MIYTKCEVKFDRDTRGGVTAFGLNEHLAKSQGKEVEHMFLAMLLKM